VGWKTRFNAYFTESHERASGNVLGPSTAPVRATGRIRVSRKIRDDPAHGCRLMSIEASYRRIPVAAWGQLLPFLDRDDALAAWGDGYEAYTSIADPGELKSSDRYLSIDGDWHALHVLLTGEIRSLAEIEPAEPPLDNVVMGGNDTPFDAGYGKVRYLAPYEVREVAEALRTIPEEELRARFDPVAFTRAEIYPTSRRNGWDSKAVERLVRTYRQLVAFFRAAAREGDVVLLSFD
jgi:hypothetical protein